MPVPSAPARARPALGARAGRSAGGRDRECGISAAVAVVVVITSVVRVAERRAADGLRRARARPTAAIVVVIITIGTRDLPTAPRYHDRGVVAVAVPVVVDGPQPLPRQTAPVEAVQLV